MPLPNTTAANAFAQYYYTKTELNAGQLDNLYFGEDEFLNSSAGAGDAGKPVKLDANGHIDASMINDADVDHGGLGGLSDDDHSQYALLAGRSGGQTLIGGTASGNNLTINSTSHATKGDVLVNTGGGNLGLGTSSPSRILHLAASAGSFIRLSNTGAANDTEVNGLVEWYRGENTSRTAYLGHPSTGTTDFLINNQAGANLDLYTSNSFRVRVDATGVGIGTTSISNALEVSGTANATNVTVGGVDVVTLTGSQTLTNKTLTTPVISTISNTGTLTLPTSTDTLVGRATTDTLTNKTLTAPTINTPTLDDSTLTGTFSYQHNVAGDDMVVVSKFNASDTGTTITARSARTSSTAFFLYKGIIDYDGTPSTVFSVRGDGLTTVSTLAATSATVGGVDVVTLTDSQTLTNKTLTSPTINTPTIATPTITTSATVPLVYGGTASNGDITIHGTSHATKTSSTVYLQPSGGNVGIGFSSNPGVILAAQKNNAGVYISPSHSGGDDTIIYAYNGNTTSDIPLQLQGGELKLYSLDANRFFFSGTFTPTSGADSAGSEGDVSFDDNYIYRKVSTGWKRAALSTW